jgi:hypothetical protein
MDLFIRAPLLVSYLIHIRIISQRTEILVWGEKKHSNSFLGVLQEQNYRIKQSVPTTS